MVWGTRWFGALGGLGHWVVWGPGGFGALGGLGAWGVWGTGWFGALVGLGPWGVWGALNKNSVGPLIGFLFITNVFLGGPQTNCRALNKCTFCLLGWAGPEYGRDCTEQ